MGEHTLGENGSTSVVAARGLTKQYGEGDLAQRVLDGVDVEVPRGGFVSIMGPSGSGKSTLLHLLGGLDTRIAIVEQRQRGSAAPSQDRPPGPFVLTSCHGAHRTQRRGQILSAPAKISRWIPRHGSCGCCRCCSRGRDGAPQT